jgi:hypothetical protein
MSNLTNKPYDMAEIEWLRKFRPTHSIDETVIEFNKHFDVNYTSSMIKHRCFKYNIKSNYDGKFKKGGKSWSKGLNIKEQRKDIYEQYTKGARYHFQKGHIPKSTKPIGYEKKYRDCIFIKVAMPNVWMNKARYVYEQTHNVKLTTKDKILHLNGDKHDCSADNLICVTDAVLARLNKLGLISKNKEITKSAVYTQKLLQKIYEIEKKMKKT